MTKQAQTASEVVHIRYRGDQMELIKAAAKIVNQTARDFIMDTVHQMAVDTILDQRVFILDSAVIDDIFDKPPRPTQNLIDLMASTAPWDQAKPG